MKRAGNQFGLRELFVIVTLCCPVLACVGADIELAREAFRRSQCLPGLRQGHPYWSTPEGQRALADEKKWCETRDARRFREKVAGCALVVVAAWQAMRVVGFLKVRRAERLRKERHAAG